MRRLSCLPTSSFVLRTKKATASKWEHGGFLFGQLHSPTAASTTRQLALKRNAKERQKEGLSLGVQSRHSGFGRLSERRFPYESESTMKDSASSSLSRTPSCEQLMRKALFKTPSQRRKNRSSGGRFLRISQKEDAKERDAFDSNSGKTAGEAGKGLSASPLHSEYPEVKTGTLAPRPLPPLALRGSEEEASLALSFAEWTLGIADLKSLADPVASLCNETLWGGRRSSEDSTGSPADSLGAREDGKEPRVSLPTPFLSSPSESLLRTISSHAREGVPSCLSRRGGGSGGGGGGA